jgi:hypothetical protein
MPVILTVLAVVPVMLCVVPVLAEVVDVAIAKPAVGVVCVSTV